MRHYFRRHGRRVRLEGAFGSDEFLAAYAHALAETATPAPPERKPAPSGSLAALAAAYFTSPRFLALAKSSRTNYRRVIEGFLAEHGHRRVDQMKREHIETILAKLGDTPGAAIVLLKRIRTLVRYAIALHWRDTDPTVGLRGAKSNEIHTWTETEIAQFERRWKVGTRQRLAFDLLLYTGQRGSDVCTMARPAAGEKIRVAQQKTRAKLALMVHPALRRSLDACPSGHVAALVTAFGRPFSVKGFGQFVSAAIGKAKLPAHCKAHGLRKAAARRLAEAGCTAHEIMAVTGHKTLAEVERYTRAVEQERLNASAMAKQSGNGPVANPPRPSGKLVENK